MLYPNEVIIDDDTPSDDLFRVKIDGELMGRGAVPRDYDIQPEEFFAPPGEMPLIPKSEWSDRIKEQEKHKSRISDVLLRAGVPATNQKSDGYCWSYSSSGCVIALRALSGQSYLKLNPHAPAAIIKRGANQGGWCGLSAAWLREHGIPTEEFWPANSRSLSHDTPEMRANAALHKVTEDWFDLARPLHGQKLTFEQVATCLLNNVPVALDFNHWSHSVMGSDLVEVEPGDFGIRIRNSWGDGWGEKGFGIMRGRKALPDGAIGIRVTGGTAK
jgi:hypothetical protein